MSLDDLGLGNMRGMAGAPLDRGDEAECLHGGIDDFRESFGAVSREAIVARRRVGTEGMPGDAILEFEQQTGGVIAVRAGAVGGDAIHLCDAPDDVDHAVHKVNADSGQNPGGFFLGEQPPGVA